MSKIAVSGKGGVGKTLFSSLLAYILAEEGRIVYAIDADPNPTLAQALGFPDELVKQVVPIVAMSDLIEERTGAKPGEYGAYFKLNPRVDDIPARFSVVYRGIHLMQMGSVKGAGMGCACPENTMLKALTTHLLLREKETVIMDMVAGLEHLGRPHRTKAEQRCEPPPQVVMASILHAVVSPIAQHHPHPLAALQQGRLLLHSSKADQALRR